MKTTVELPDGLLREAKRVARRRGTTLKALLEHGLRLTLAEAKTPSPFTLRDASVGGHGMNPELAGHGWDAIRDLTYKDRGA
jgi:hypothetical protein